MDPYKISDIDKLLASNSYVGRGIIVGESENTGNAVFAYFIMGRSANSRNRVFHVQDAEVYTRAFNESKVKDPSLIIYPAVKNFENKIIVTNGDQTDTLYQGFLRGRSFEELLCEREFEPDDPNFTPRISALVELGDSGFRYKMNILKSEDPHGKACARYTFSYTPMPGLGHFIHTYVCDGDPLPSFCGEPERIHIIDDIDAFTDRIWYNLDEDNKISLYVRYTDPASGTFKDRVVNRNQ